VPHVVTLTDAAGNTTALTARTVSAHAVEVQIPSSASSGGAYFTFTSGTQKYFGTLFLDAVDNIPLNGCTYEVSLSSSTVPTTTSSLPILVVTQAGCQYQVLAKDPFVTAGPGGAGTSVISVSFSATSAASRTTTIEIAGQPFTVTQTTQNVTVASPNF